MMFNPSKSVEKFGKCVGYVFGYLVFTTMLYIILFLLKRLPAGGSYENIAGITILIVVCGEVLKKILK